MLSQCEFIQSIRSWKELGITESYLLFGWKESTAALITDDGAMTLLGRNSSVALCNIMEAKLPMDQGKSQLLLYTCEYYTSNTQVFYERLCDKVVFTPLSMSPRPTNKYLASSFT